MRTAPLLVIGFTCFVLTAGAAAQDAVRRGRHESSSRNQYFIDFRARGGGILGHTYIVYGRLDARGRAVEINHAGLNPDDAYGNSPILAVALVPGQISLKREDPKKPTVAVYRRRLTATQYAHLKGTVHRLRATHRNWHMAFYNCNDFAGQVARELGMMAPLAWARPGTFVNGLRALNGP